MTTSVIDSKVLVLNKYYAPVNVTTVKIAFSKLVSGVAEAIMVEDGVPTNHDFSSWTEISELKSMYKSPEDIDWVHTPSTAFIVPRVIRLLTFDRLQMDFVKLTRRNIFERDHYTCQYCGKTFSKNSNGLNIEHIIPKSKGGKNTWKNLVASCLKCNQRKGDKTPKQANMQLLRKPFKPKANFNIKVKLGKKKYKDWDMFVSDLYYNTEIKN